jgi:hypothetical protein
MKLIPLFESMYHVSKLVIIPLVKQECNKINIFLLFESMYQYGFEIALYPHLKSMSFSQNRHPTIITRHKTLYLMAVIHKYATVR